MLTTSSSTTMGVDERARGLLLDGGVALGGRALAVDARVGWAYDGTDLEWISFIWAPILRTRSRRDFWSCSMVERTADDFASSSERCKAFLEPTTKDEEVLGRHVLRADSHQVAMSLTT